MPRHSGLEDETAGQRELALGVYGQVRRHPQRKIDLAALIDREVAIHRTLNAGAIDSITRGRIAAERDAAGDASQVQEHGVTSVVPEGVARDQKVFGTA